MPTDPPPSSVAGGGACGAATVIAAVQLLTVLDRLALAVFVVARAHRIAVAG